MIEGINLQILTKGIIKIEKQTKNIKPGQKLWLNPRNGKATTRHIRKEYPLIGMAWESAGEDDKYILLGINNGY